MRKFNDLLLAEESFFKQKVRVDWITEGDQNTKFFQKTVTVHQHCNIIKFFINVTVH